MTFTESKALLSRRTMLFTFPLSNSIRKTAAQPQHLVIILHLIAVGVWLEWTRLWDSNVVALLLSENGEVGTKCWQMQHSNLLIKMLWQKPDLTAVVLSGVPLLPELNLGHDLVGE